MSVTSSFIAFQRVVVAEDCVTHPMRPVMEKMLERLPRHDTKVRDSFKTQFAGSVNRYPRSSDITPALCGQFCTTLATSKRSFNENPHSDKIGQINEHLENTKQIMLENLDKLIDRGERIESLCDKTEQLRDEAQGFHSNARSLKRKMLIRNIKLAIGLLLVLCFVALIIAFLICGVDFKKFQMVVLGLDSTKWLDAIKSSPDCLISPASAQNVENVLSKASTRRHQKILFKGLEPFMAKVIEDFSGISILTSLVKYGTTVTVNGIAGAILRTYDNIFKGQGTGEVVCEDSLGILLERIVYREDCTEDCRLGLIKALKSMDYSSLMGASLFVLATARLILIDKEFATLFCSSLEARKAFFQLSSSPVKRDLLKRFCEVVLCKAESEERGLTDLCSTFIFTSLSSLYAPNASLRPCKQITSLLASHGSTLVIQEMARHFSAWPDIRTQAKKEDYARVMALILRNLQDTDIGVSLVKTIFQSKEDVDERLASRKASHLQLFAVIAGKPAYVDALTEALGESQEKKLIAAVAWYRKITQPRVLATKEALVDRLKQIRKRPVSNDAVDTVCKKARR